MQSINNLENLINEKDIICLSHLRWDFVYQRPQHLLSRFAKKQRIFFVEEPIFYDGEITLEVSRREDNLYVALPKLPHNISELPSIQAKLISGLIDEYKIDDYILWFYTPMSIEWTEHLKPKLVVYDCMDELSAFKGAPTNLKENEKKLLQNADLVFTGGQSIYQAKKNQHPNIHAFPSSIEKEHFAQARNNSNEPSDQGKIAKPRIGFFGVLDERLDIDLIRNLAEKRPEWQIILIGPVVKIDPDILPKLANIHYLGQKNYKELPNYLADWDIAALFFARNEATKFISPTKTPEYLAAGKPVISTSIQDVIEPYERLGLVEIADTADDFIEKAETLLQRTPAEKGKWLNRVDDFLKNISWDQTCNNMRSLMNEALSKKESSKSQSVKVEEVIKVEAGR